MPATTNHGYSVELGTRSTHPSGLSDMVQARSLSKEAWEGQKRRAKLSWLRSHFVWEGKRR